MQMISTLLFRTAKKSQHLCARCFSKARIKLMKTQKILRYFDENHGYIVSPNIAGLREKIQFTATAKSISLNKLDVELCQQIKNVDINGMLFLLNSLAAVNSAELPQTIFYQTFLNVVRKGAWKWTDWNNLVEIIYFVGYLNGQEDSKSLMILFLHTVNEHMDLPQAHYKDICVICEAAFRTSTLVVSPTILIRISQVLHHHCDEMTNNSTWLVMILKTMIFSKYLNVDLLEMLAEKWAKPRLISEMPFTARCYVMSLYAHAGLRSDKLFNICIESIGRTFDKECGEYRIKDVALFLWSVSSLRYNLSQEWLHSSVVPYLMSRLELRHSKEGLNLFIKACISMWIMNCLATPVFERIITMETLNFVKCMKNQRESSRMALLLDIVHAESPSTMNEEQRNVKEALASSNLLVPSIKKELEKRPLLKNLAKDLRQAGFQDVKFEYPVKFYTLGVSATLGHLRVHTDLLDKTQTLTNSMQPGGVQAAKVKLLKKLRPEISHLYVTEAHIDRNCRSEEWLALFKL